MLYGWRGYEVDGRLELPMRAGLCKIRGTGVGGKRVTGLARVSMQNHLECGMCNMGRPMDRASATEHGVDGIC